MRSMTPCPGFSAAHLNDGAVLPTTSTVCPNLCHFPTETYTLSLQPHGCDGALHQRCLLWVLGLGCCSLCIVLSCTDKALQGSRCSLSGYVGDPGYNSYEVDRSTKHAGRILCCTGASAPNCAAPSKVTDQGLLRSGSRVLCHWLGSLQVHISIQGQAKTHCIAPESGARLSQQTITLIHRSQQCCRQASANCSYSACREHCQRM
jgi:hypothetical protein